MWDKERKIVAWFIIVPGFVLLLYGIFGTADKADREAVIVEKYQKFEVVDTYKNCSVVRYTDPSQRWNYLLHCP
jgi:hypothetical protein